ncbi:MAG: hypothetical protein JWM76_1465 [Pseudonocardiales bacterium]|nr:hypothetical protein [Pseudonocardiales bacterium]
MPQHPESPVSSENRPPLVGVVVPAFNAEKWIEATLRTLQQQDFTDWTCVVIDDGSSDATAAIVERLLSDDPRIHLISQPNAGLPAARNAGIAALPESCVYVAFLDSDDLYDPDTLSLLVKALADRPDAVGAYGLADYVDENGDVLWPGLHPSRQRDRRLIQGWRLRSVPVQADATFATMVVAGPIWPPAVALQQLSAVRAVGGFDPSFSSQEDWDFYVRISRQGPYATLDRRLAWYRRHDKNLTSEHYKSVYQQDRVRRNAYRSPENSPLQTKQVARAWRYLEARQAAVLGRGVVRSVRQQRWREAGRYAIGGVICSSLLVRPGPPPASARRVRYTRPATLPGAALFPA